MEEKVPNYDQIIPYIYDFFLWYTLISTEISLHNFGN